MSKIRYLVIFGICALCTFGADKLEVQAKTFSSDDRAGRTELKGEVFIKKGADKLWADVVIVSTDKNRKPLEYTATGKVKFYVETQDGRKINGSAQKVIYDTINDEYRLYENAKIQEIGSPNTITGEFITLNNKKGQAYSEGAKDKPTTLIFELNDDNEKK
ncbi:lipopolysaccharide transport periplasmic protein LptA [Helicobacter himalayensis]|uniref:lipopolysaccharide transport periplasmic protein LptA n=1 Tax=Helicobacter himalayensis TaxID=1591088 RepID=UPI00082A8997|nr:lipopolysaccharide transport periplasmic protein LptA [Helicobacter himalayensis]